MAYFDKYGVEFSDDRKTLVRCPEDFQGEYVIPDSVTRIKDYAFNGCFGLTSIVIPNSVICLEEGAFFGCSGLTHISIPNSVISIEESAFGDCNKLSCVSVEQGNAVYDSRDNCNAIIETATNTLIVGCKNTIIPNSVTCIGNYAFDYCIDLASIVIPNSVISLGEGAFCGCTSLKSVTIPDNVTRIDSWAFYGCSSLISISIPSSVTSIGNDVFADCENLTSVKIPNSVTKIGNKVFSGCKKLNTRSWEECVAEWEKCKQTFKSNKAIYDMIEAGSVPAAFPPIGVCLTIAEYNQFKNEKRDLKKIQGWCYSGKSFHAMVRLFSHLPNGDDSIGVGNMIGLKTPRKGFYRVIDVLDDKERTLVCYYNYHDPNEFVEEEVDISSRPLYNKASIGPKEYQLRVDDILHIKEDVQLVDAKYDGEVYTAYKIFWDYKN